MLEWPAIYGLTAVIAFALGGWIGWERGRARYKIPAAKLSRSFPDNLPEEYRQHKGYVVAALLVRLVEANLIGIRGSRVGRSAAGRT